MLARRNVLQSGWNRKLSKILWMDRNIFGKVNITRVLATLKDRVWRGVTLVERCRATLNRIHEVMFPSDPRVQGINALLECFRGVGPIRNFITERLIMGANATMAYIRSQRPTLTFRPPAPGESLSRQNMDGTFDCA